MDAADPTTCTECGAALKGGWVTLYQERAGEIAQTGVLCLPCDEKRRIASYLSSRRLSTRLLTDAALWRIDVERLFGWGDKPPAAFLNDDPERRRLIRERLAEVDKGKEALYRELCVAQDALDQAIRLWDRAVWTHWLQRWHKESQVRGGSAQIGDFKMLSWACAGRVMVTLEERDSSVTLLGYEDEGGCGLRGVDATLGEALRLLDYATRCSSALRGHQKTDEQVGMAGL